MLDNYSSNKPDEQQPLPKYPSLDSLTPLDSGKFQRPFVAPFPLSPKAIPAPVAPLTPDDVLPLPFVDGFMARLHDDETVTKTVKRALALLPHAHVAAWVARSGSAGAAVYVRPGQPFALLIYTDGADGVWLDVATGFGTLFDALRHFEGVDTDIDGDED